MPRGDRTGPTGTGPMTGRAAGRCAGNQASEYAGVRGGGGRASGGGARGGRRRRNRFRATGLTGWQRAAGTPDVEDEPVAAAAPSEAESPLATGNEEGIDVLRQQAESMAEQVNRLRERIEQLEAQE